MPLFETNEEAGRFELLLPKIPKKVWRSIVGFFMHQADNGREAAAVILFDKDRRKYCTFVPRQRAGMVSVEFDKAEVYALLDEHPSLVWVADLHSHHRMPAFFSSVDDADERSTRIYGVFGNLDADRGYTFRFRAGVQGRYITIPAEAVLEDFGSHNAWTEKLQAYHYATGWNAQVN